uniref:Peptidoglycan binding-like domain-containing protein n=1 Tax=Ciona savignyi TaxID=51511 RepID=H2Z9Z5_CIOSA
MKLTILLSLFVTIWGFPAPDPDEAQIRNVRSADLGDLLKWNPVTASEYLGKFGYMSQKRAASTKLGGLIDKKSFSKSIRHFQRMAGLSPSGELNRETMRMMSMDRCGVEDTLGAFMMGSNGNKANSKFVNKNKRRRLNKKRKAQRRRRK